MRGAKPLLFAVILAAIAASGHAPAQGAPLKMIWGPNDLPSGKSAFPLYVRLGVDVLQVQLQWNRTAQQRPADPTNPADPAYDWPSDVAKAIARANNSGIKVMLMLRDTPRWANGGRSAKWAPRRDSDFADFAAAASKQFPSVRHWMIWGEPQRGDSFFPMPPGKPRGPRRYAKLLDAAYGALKAVDARDLVIGANTWSFGPVTPVQFLRWMRLPNGKPPRLDYYGHNPFSLRFPRLSRKPYYKGLRDISDIDTFSREVNRAYRSRNLRPKLWLSEYTVPSAPNRIMNFSVSRKGQARWLRAAFRVAQRSRRVKGMGWFRLLDTPELESGLLTKRGKAKPALAAFKRAL